MGKILNLIASFSMEVNKPNLYRAVKDASIKLFGVDEDEKEVFIGSRDRRQIGIFPTARRYDTDHRYVLINVQEGRNWDFDDVMDEATCYLDTLSSRYKIVSSFRDSELGTTTEGGLMRVKKYVWTLQKL